MGVRSIDLTKVFAKKIHVTELEEKGKPSKLIGLELNNGTIWYPRYKDNLQILEELAKKEDFKYPPEKGFEGRNKLFQAIQELFEGRELKEICKQHKLPPPYDPIPVEYHKNDINNDALPGLADFLRVLPAGDTLNE